MLVIGKDFSPLMIFSVIVLCLLELGLVLGWMVEILLMIGKGTFSPLGVFAYLGHAELMVLVIFYWPYFGVSCMARTT